MNVNIGQIISNTFEMIKQRFWLLLGVWAVFLALTIALFVGFSVMIGGSMVGLAALRSGGLDNPATLGGLGAGFIISGIVFYVGFILLSVAQQAAMTVMASPIEKPALGDALARGFRTALTFLGLLVLFIIAYVIFILLSMLVIAVLSVLGDVGAIIGSVLLFLVTIYILCRFATIMAVVAVEQVFNPITALNHAWSQTNGRVVGILVILVISVLAALVLFAVPVLLMFGAAGGALASGDPAAMEDAGAMVGFVFLLLFPLFVVYQIFSVTLSACLHADISEHHAEAVRSVFE